MLIVVGLALIAAIGFIRLNRARKSASAQLGAMASARTAASSNQDIDPGTFAGDTPAPDFQLVDQTGRKTSLALFRGKVALIAFVDSQCTTICPLTTESMVEALRLLGPAAANVQLLGINANPLALKVSDVAAYTRVHEMQGKWRFLTGTLPQLKKVWRDYHVYVSAINNDIDHQSAMMLIDPLGREHKAYLTQMSYEGVAPQAQILADDIANLLPGRAAAQTASLAYIPPLNPNAAAVQMPVADRQRTIAVGGPQAQLLLFFASWLDQNSNVATEIRDLDRYAARARRKGWPLPVAVDELTTESSTANGQKFVAQISAETRTPIVEDANGRLGDGYGVEDLPWYALRSSEGKIIWSHDGWLSSAELQRQVSAALEKSRERATATTMRPTPSAAVANRSSSAAN